MNISPKQVDRAEIRRINSTIMTHQGAIHQRQEWIKKLELKKKQIKELYGKIDWEWNKLPKIKRKALAIKAGLLEDIAQRMSQKQDWQDVCHGDDMLCGVNASIVLEYMRKEKIVYE